MLIRTAYIPSLTNWSHALPSVSKSVCSPQARNYPACAQHYVSQHTVVATYDQLVASGLMEARKQRGFYVRDHIYKK